MTTTVTFTIHWWWVIAGVVVLVAAGLWEFGPYIIIAERMKRGE